MSCDTSRTLLSNRDSKSECWTLNLQVALYHGDHLLLCEHAGIDLDPTFATIIFGFIDRAFIALLAEIDRQCSLRPPPLGLTEMPEAQQKMGIPEIWSRLNPFAVHRFDAPHDFILPLFLIPEKTRETVLNRPWTPGHQDMECMSKMLNVSVLQGFTPHGWHP